MEFKTLWEKVKGYSAGPEHRVRALWNAARTLEVPGDIVELGVYQGATLEALAAAQPERAVFGYDTFSEMPDLAQSIDSHHAGDFKVDFVEVYSRLSTWRNIRLVVGTFPAAVIAHPIALAHFDGDLYQSCRDFIRWTVPQLSPGGLLVFDDYDWPQCLGVRKAVKEAGLKVDMLEGGEYQAVFRKP